jgi:hypothetical protein
MDARGPAVLAGSGEQGYQAVGCVVAEAEAEDVVGRGFGGAGEQGQFVLGQGGLDVLGVRGEGLAEFGAVEHGQVGAVAVRGHEVGGVAEQGHAGDAVPPVFGGQGVDGARDGCGVGVGDQRGELRRPAVELLDDARDGRGRVGEVDAGEPVQRLDELRVGVQGSAALPVGGDPLARHEREHRPPPTAFALAGCRVSPSNR